MRVKVTPININGRPQVRKARECRETYVGDLRVCENRLHALGRVVVTASVLNSTDHVETATRELYDVSLLWAEKNRMRLRGFEEVGGVQYAQTWDVEVC